MTKLLPVLLLFTLGCSTTSNLGGFKGTVNHSADEVQISSLSGWFSDGTLQKALNENIVDEKGDFLLEEVIENYPNQTVGLSDTEDFNSELSFRIRSVEVKNGMTINIPDPGPIYKLKMDVDIFANGEFVEMEQVKARVNMASVVNEEKVFNWLTTEEKSDTNNQLLTFEVGLTRLYQKLYFKYFDINLNTL